MNKITSQLRPFWGILRASLLATVRNPASIVFGFVFPLVFILVFGFLGGGSADLKVVLDKASDKDNQIYEGLKNTENIDLRENIEQKQIDEDLKKGNIDAVIKIEKVQTEQIPKININVTTTAASPQNGYAFLTQMRGIASEINLTKLKDEDKFIKVSDNQVEGRKFTTIDFILPGQLGFSLLSSGIFATAFVFITLKQTLVLKRFFTTTVSKGTIIIGEGVSRLIFATLQSSFIIIVGALFFDYTLIDHFTTFLQMIGLSLIGLTVFLGLGFIVSSVAKDERTAAPLAQLFTLPQFLLAGTFFSIDLFPSWLQPVSRIMPLYFLNTAMRKVAFEGAPFSEVLPYILYLLIAGVVIYAVAIKVFKWE